MISRFGLASIIISVAVCSGCCGKKDWHAQTFPVSGSLTINGSPAANAVILAHLSTGKIDNPGTIPYAIVDETGLFNFTTYATNDGLPEGEFLLTLTWPMTLSTPNAADRLADKFTNLENAIATFKVTKGKNTFPPVELKNVKVLPVKLPPPR